VGSHTRWSAGVLPVPVMQVCEIWTKKNEWSSNGCYSGSVGGLHASLKHALPLFWLGYSFFPRCLLRRICLLLEGVSKPVSPSSLCSLSLAAAAAAVNLSGCVQSQYSVPSITTISMLFVIVVTLQILIPSCLFSNTAPSSRCVQVHIVSKDPAKA